MIAAVLSASAFSVESASFSVNTVPFSLLSLGSALLLRFPCFFLFGLLFKLILFTMSDVC